MAEAAKKVAGLRLNLGCGSNKLDGYVNVDREGSTGPDVKMDLERFPWPWPDNSVEEIVFHHVLEHLGRELDVYRELWREVYRVCQDGAQVRITVPHPRHEHFLGDPTHVRPIHPLQMSLLDKENCDRWQRDGAANTPLAHYWRVNFKLASLELVPDPRWHLFREPGERSPEALELDAETLCGMVDEIRMVLECRKPFR